MENKNKDPAAEDADARLLKGLAMILSALPELIYRYLANRKK